MKQIIYKNQAKKALLKMPSNTAKRIMSKIEAYAANPASQANNIKQLKGMDGALRLRVGSWRVILDNGTVIDVIKIAPRGSAY